jgi:hypothetical protein
MKQGMGKSRKTSVCPFRYSRSYCNSKNRSEHSAYITMFRIRRRLIKGEKEKAGEEVIEETKNL